MMVVGRNSTALSSRKDRKWKIARQKSRMAQKNSLRNTKSIARLLMEATMSYWTRPVHRLTLDHCFKPVLTSCTSHQIHTFKVHPPPSSTSVQSSLCLVTVSEQIVEKRSCGEDIFIHIQPCQFPLP